MYSKLKKYKNCRSVDTHAVVNVKVISLVAYTRRISVNQKICTINSVKKKNILINIIAPANGPSFLYQKTVLDEWYEKWSRLEVPHDHL